MKNHFTCDSFFEKLLADKLADCFSVALERGGELVYEFYGTNHRKVEYADFSSETRFNIGSVTKIITASLLIKLVENGEVAVSEKVKKFIPEFPFGDVELGHLLLHTSGCTVSKKSDASPHTQSSASIYSRLERSRPPNEDMQYWSAGYTVIMDVIQRVAGLSLEEFARRELFDRLGMEHTTFDLNTIPENRRVFAVDPGTDELIDFSTVPVTGDSGLYSTPGELLKLSRDLLKTYKTRKRGAFSPYAVDLMFREITGGRHDRTLVFWKKSDRRVFSRCAGDLNSPSTLFHTGYTGCILLLDPEYDLSLCMLTNSLKLHSDDSNYTRIINRLMDEIDQELK